MYSWGIIGIGNIGSALAEGLSATGQRPYIYDKHYEKLTEMKERAGCDLGSGVADVIESSQVVLLCIRTDQLDDFMLTNGVDPAERTIVLLQAGFRLSSLPVKKEKKIGLLRAITNINIMSRNGYTVILKNDRNGDYEKVKKMFTELGEVLEVDTEEELALYSLPSGCGPAPVLAFYESLKEKAINMGLDKSVASDMVANIMIGSIKAMLTSSIPPTALAQRVGTKSGIVETSIREMQGERWFDREISRYFDRIRNGY